MTSEFYHNPESTSASDYVPDATDFTGEKFNTLRAVPSDMQDDLREHIAPFDTVGLGRAAVVAEVGDVKAVLAERSETPQADELLHDAYARMESLSEGDRDTINQFIRSAEMPEWLVNMIGVPEGKDEPNYVKLLTRRDKAGEYVLGRQVRMNFLEWHNAALARKTAEFREQEGEYVAAFRKRFEELIGKGIVPASAARNLERLDKLEIVVDDGLATLSAGALGWTISTNRGYGMIVLGPDDAPFETVQHELMHVAEGRDPDSSPDIEWRDHAHDMYRLFAYEGENIQEDGGLMLGEAMTEYLANQPDINSDFIDIPKLGDVNYPYSPEIDQRSYGNERVLLGVLSQLGLQRIRPLYFAEAYFDDGSGRGVDELIARFRAAFPGKYGKEQQDIVNFIGTINRHVRLSGHDPYYGKRRWDLPVSDAGINSDVVDIIDELVRGNGEYVKNNGRVTAEQKAQAYEAVIRAEAIWCGQLYLSDGSMVPLYRLAEEDGAHATAYYRVIDRAIKGELGERGESDAEIASALYGDGAESFDDPIWNDPNLLKFLTYEADPILFESVLNKIVRDPDVVRQYELKFNSEQLDRICNEASVLLDPWEDEDADSAAKLIDVLSGQLSAEQKARLEEAGKMAPV